jgi:dolichyl-phosphate beta-glucosyltransferase
MYQYYTVSFVLPLYKPKGDWARHFSENIAELNAALPGEQIQYIVVHDGPEEEDLAERFRFLADIHKHLTLLSYGENRGKGYALRHGVQRAQADLIVTLDFDFPYKTKNICELVRDLKKGSDIVAGRRSRHYFDDLPAKRRMISKTYSTLNGLFFQLPLNDTQSGMKGFNQRGKTVFLQTVVDQFLIDTEFLLRAHKNNLTITVIDIDLRPHITFSNFGMNVLKTELKNFFFLLWLNKTLRPETRKRPVYKKVFKQKRKPVAGQ